MIEPNYEELKAQLEALKAKEARSGNISFKVSDKGAVYCLCVLKFNPFLTSSASKLSATPKTLGFPLSYKRTANWRLGKRSCVFIRNINTVWSSCRSTSFGTPRLIGILAAPSLSSRGGDRRFLHVLQERPSLNRRDCHGSKMKGAFNDPSLGTPFHRRHC